MNTSDNKPPTDTSKPTDPKPSPQAMEAGHRLIVETVKLFPWGPVMKKIGREHWDIVEVQIQVREKLLGGVAITLDAEEAYIKKNGLEDVIKVREAAAIENATHDEKEAMAEDVKMQGLCTFHRRENKEGLWFPTNHLKAGFKENFSVLGYTVDATPRSQRKPDAATWDGDVPDDAEDEGTDDITKAKAKKKGKGKKGIIQGGKGGIREGFFVFSANTDSVEKNWVYLADKPDGVHQGITVVDGPKGRLTSIKRNEFVTGTKMTFYLAIAKAVLKKIPKESLADTMLHMMEHGIGACRSQGFGMFNILNIRDIVGEEYLRICDAYSPNF